MFFTTILGVGIPLNFEGKPTRSFGISWSEMPHTIGFIRPYLITPLTNFVEVRILDNSCKKETLIQMVPLNGIQFISQPSCVDMDERQMDEGTGVGQAPQEKVDPDDDILPEKRMFLASKNNIYVLAMKQPHIQVRELQNKKDFELALVLCDKFENTPYEVEKSVINFVHTDYGFYLFAEGDFEGAMEHFTKTEVDPRIVISLYPDLAPKIANTFSVAVPLSPEDKKKIEKNFEDVEQRSTALNTLIPFLSCRRVPVSKEITGDDMAIAEAVDTALLKAFLLTNDAQFVIKFIESPNRCNIQECERYLNHFKVLFSNHVIFCIEIFGIGTLFQEQRIA